MPHARPWVMFVMQMTMPLRADWLVTGALQKMVLVVTSVATKEVLERWTFDIQTDKEVLVGG